MTPTKEIILIGNKQLEITYFNSLFPQQLAELAKLQIIHRVFDTNDILAVIDINNFAAIARKTSRGLVPILELIPPYSLVNTSYKFFKNLKKRQLEIPIQNLTENPTNGMVKLVHEIGHALNLEEELKKHSQYQDSYDAIYKASKQLTPLSDISTIIEMVIEAEYMLFQEEPKAWKSAQPLINPLEVSRPNLDRLKYSSLNNYQQTMTNRVMQVVNLALYKLVSLQSIEQNITEEEIVQRYYQQQKAITLSIPSLTNEHQRHKIPLYIP
jgi:hypothetical protein